MKRNFKGLLKLSFDKNEALYTAGLALPFITLPLGGYIGHRITKGTKSKWKKAFVTAPNK